MIENTKTSTEMSPLPPIAWPEETRDSCELFKVCELVAERYRQACALDSDRAKVLRCLEQEVGEYFDLGQERASQLIALSMELSHLQANGDYITSELEVGRMISVVTDGWVEPGSN